MAVGSDRADSAAVSAGRRFAIGVNVVIAIAAAAALLVAVNWICSLKSIRRDLAAYSHYGLSDRTKRILDGYPDDVKLSVLYAPDPEDEEQQGYIERLLDYCDEVQRYADGATVTHVATDSQREKVVSEISLTFGGEAEKHKACLDSFDRLRGELAAELDQRLAAAGELMDGESWLGDFPLFASVVSTLRVDKETLKKAAEEIAELAPAGGIPKYADATAKAKSSLAGIKGHFEAIDQRLGELAALAVETSRPDSVYIAMLRQVASASQASVASLRELVGEADAPMPDDMGAALKALADRGVEVGNELSALVRRVDEFARQFPMVRQHPDWSAQVRTGPLAIRMEVADVLQRVGQTLGRIRLSILSVLDRSDPQVLRQSVVDVRNHVAGFEQNASVCVQLMTTLANRLSALDERSKAILDASQSGGLFAAQISAIDTLIKEIDDLPDLKLGGVADQLKGDNVVVVEANGKIRVVSFAEVFPMREGVGGPGAPKEDLGRTFNGDSALSSAVLALTRDTPFATVVLVSFEPPAPQQRQQFASPPPRSWIPSRNLSVLRERLEAANFKVVDWNLATSGTSPEPDEGTENVYVLLPPAPPAQPSPFGGQPPLGPTFGDEHRKRIRDLLAEDARMIFLATWEVVTGGFFSKPRTPPYGYAPLLAEDWGIHVDNSRRIVWIEPDRQKPNTLMVAPRRFNHMPAGRFGDHAVGAPMRGTRFLINDACPIEISETLPDGVSVETVLYVPNKENYIGANVADILRIINQLQNHSLGGKVTLTPFPSGGPFDLLVAAERQEGERSKGKIVVMAFGASIRDDYLKNPVMRSGDVLRLDPPPRENLDLFVNVLYWLQGQSQWIARGTVPVPRVEPIEAGELMALRVFVWAGWPALVFAPGILLWWIRRK